MKIRLLKDWQIGGAPSEDPDDPKAGDILELDGGFSEGSVYAGGWLFSRAAGDDWEVIEEEQALEGEAVVELGAAKVTFRGSVEFVRLMIKEFNDE